MNGGKPVIGITSAYDLEKGFSWLREDYYDAIISSGAIPVLIPLTDNKSVLAEYLNICDGMIFSGGPDVDAAYFGAVNMPYGREISPVRDSMEIFLAKNAIAMNMPILAICRGIQVINIAAGGSIFQDIYAENIEGVKLLKHSQEAPRWFKIHDILIRRDTPLYDIFKTDSLKVNSFHHQAVSVVAPDFSINACSSDGMVEAISHKTKRFVIGVQWHPENLWRKDPVHLKLFERLVSVC